MTPEEAYKLGREVTLILTNPFKDECTLARKWVDGWYDAFIERQGQQ